MTSLESQDQSINLTTNTLYQQTLVNFQPIHDGLVNDFAELLGVERTTLQLKTKSVPNPSYDPGSTEIGNVPNYTKFIITIIYDCDPNNPAIDEEQFKSNWNQFVTRLPSLPRLKSSFIFKTEPKITESDLQPTSASLPTDENTWKSYDDNNKPNHSTSLSMSFIYILFISTLFILFY